MVLRWLIRGVCLVLLAGVVGVGAGSYAGGLWMLKCSAGRIWEVGAVQGLGYMARSPDTSDPAHPFRFDFERGWTATIIGMSARTLGFYGGRGPWDPDEWLIIFPLWLPTLLLVVLNGFVWRWTRRRIVGAVGFPVEPAKKPDA